ERQPGRDRAVSRGTSRRHAVVRRQATVAQGVAGRPAHSAEIEIGWNRHAQEPDAEPRGTTLYRLCARSRQTHGEGIMMPKSSGATAVVERPKDSPNRLPRSGAAIGRQAG